jgi:hypothetical protein
MPPPNIARAEVAMPFSERAAQPGVRMAVALSSDAEVMDADRRFPRGWDRTVAHDPAQDALQITIPASFATPAVAWAKSLPYTQQFDAHSEFWLQVEIKWDAGMLTPSNGGGGIKFFTIDQGDAADGTRKGSCDNDARGDIVAHVFGPQPKHRFPTLYHSCGAILLPGNQSGVYDGLYGWDPGRRNYWLQNKISGCTYGIESVPPCVGIDPNVWFTFTIHVAVGTWYRNDGKFHRDSQINLWMGAEGQPSRLLIHRTGYDLLNLGTAVGARYGKVWLLPYDTGRKNSPVDGHVWYRYLLWSSQPLKDPVTRTDLVPPR